MAVLTRRTRVLSFRISEEEYQDLINLCMMRQSRSLSDFARLATLSQFEANTSNTKSESALREVYRKLGALDREVKRLAALVEPPRLDSVASLDPVESSWVP
jgi:hypothetical protein